MEKPKNKFSSEWDRVRPTYKLLQLYGEGSFGQVLKAKHRESSQFVAIKLIKGFNKDPLNARNVLRELILLRKLSLTEHNIFTVKLIDVILPESLENFDHLFIVMESIDTDFKKLFQSVPKVDLTEEHIIVLMYNTLCALKFIHKANIVHRDLKPENMLIDSQCRVVLCDFGLARVLPSGAEKDLELNAMQKKYYVKRKSRYEEFKKEVARHVSSQKEKQRHMSPFVQTRWYRSPEVILTHKNYGKPADIWSLGVVFAEMLACSNVYSKNKGFRAKDRYIFTGSSCFPLTPQGDDMQDNDQLLKILQNLPDLDPKTDFSFLTDENEQDYQYNAFERSQSHEYTPFVEQLSKSNPELVKILTQMLEYNPHFRPTAAQLLKNPIFDEIRVPQNEEQTPIFKIKVKVDENEHKVNYNQVRGKQGSLKHLLDCIIKECQQ